MKLLLILASILIGVSIIGFSNSFAISPNQCSEYIPQPVINPESNMLFYVTLPSISDLSQTIIAANGFNINERSELLTISTPFASVDVNTDSNIVYVASSKKIQTFDGISFEKIYDKKIDIIPSGIWIDSRNLVYVSGFYTLSLHVFDEFGNPKLKTLDFEEIIVDVGFDPDTNRVFVITQEIQISHDPPPTKGQVVILNAKTNEIVDTIDIEGALTRILVNPNTNLAYLLRADSKSIMVIDKNNSLSENIELEFIPTSMTLNPIKNEIYLLNCEDSFISVFDTSMKKETARLEIKKQTPSFSANGIVYNEKTDQIFVTDFYSGLVDVIKQEEFPNNSVMEKIIQSPLKQIHSGITRDKVTCKEGLGLIFKSSDNSPACVKPTSIQKLIERGWAKSE